MDDTTTTPTNGFHVGYDNGYGYTAADWSDAPAAPAPSGPRVLRAAGGTPGPDHTAAMPDAGSALPTPAAATARYGAVSSDPSYAQTTTVALDEVASAVVAPLAAAGDGSTAARPATRRVARSLVLGAVAFAVLLAALIVLVATRPAATPFTNASVSSAARTAHSTGTRVDEHGNVIADSIAVIPAAPTTLPPVLPTVPGTIDTQSTTRSTTPVTVTPVTAPQTTLPPVTAPTTTAPSGPTTTAPATTSTTAPTTTSTTAPKPAIVTFNHPSAVNCAVPAGEVPYIPLSWTTQNAVKVTISIDGPGIYKTYPGATGSDTVPFACPGPHTYLITAYSATNQVVTQQVVLTKS